MKSLSPVPGTMTRLRRPCASSVIRRKRPRGFSHNSIRKCLRSICKSWLAMMVSMGGPWGERAGKRADVYGRGEAGSPLESTLAAILARQYVHGHMSRSLQYLTDEHGDRLAVVQP